MASQLLLPQLGPLAPSPKAAILARNNSSAAFPAPGDPGQRRQDNGEEGERLGPTSSLGIGPTSTTDLLGDLGQLASPVWASVSSSVN